MFLKSLLTGTVLASLAGAVVYFGTGGELAQADIRRAVLETKDATQTVTTSVKETFDDLKTAAMQDGPVIQEASLKTDTLTDIVNTGTVDDKNDSRQKKWLSRYLGKLKSEKDGVPFKADDENDIWAAKIESHKTIPSLLVPATAEFNDVYSTILSQAESLESQESRDRAYLNLINFSVRNGAFDKAVSVIEKISQPQFRDTARSNVAVGLARKGQQKQAFAILDEVETAALSDVLRLQVTEAIKTSTAQ